MKAFSILAFVSVVLNLAACGDLQAIRRVEIPTSIQNSKLQVSAERPFEEKVEGAYSVRNKSIILRQNSGGSAALGILLGPLGGLANGANIERLTQSFGTSAVESSFFKIDALSEASLAWGLTPENVGLKDVAPSIVMLKPYLTLFVEDDHKFVSTVLVVKVDTKAVIPTTKAGNVWTAYYFYPIVSRFSIDLLNRPLSTVELNTYHAEIQAGYKDIRTELLRDISATPPQDLKVGIVKSAFLGAQSPIFAAVGVSGEIDQRHDGGLSIRLPFSTYGGGYSEWASHVVWIFPSSSQYQFEAGPVERKKPN